MAYRNQSIYVSIDNANLSNITTDTSDAEDQILKTPLTVLYICIFVIGVIGNSLVILVIVKDRKMKSVSNFFLVSLSASDLMIILFCLPVPTYELHYTNWIFGYVLCKLTNYLQYVSVNASVLTILSISIERLLVVCVPLRARSYCTKRRTIFVIICIWIACAITSIPACSMSVYYPADPGDEPSSAKCANDTSGFEWYMYFDIVVFYVAPGGALFVIYAFIIKALRNCTVSNGGASFHRRDGNFRRISRRRESRNQLMVMLGAVVVAYFVCLLPFNVIVVMATSTPSTLSALSHTDFMTFLTVSRVLFYTNSCINPILYSAISGKFRAAFLRLFLFKRSKFFKKPMSTINSESEYRSVVTSTYRLSRKRTAIASEISSCDDPKRPNAVLQRKNGGAVARRQQQRCCSRVAIVENDDLYDNGDGSVVVMGTADNHADPETWFDAMQKKFDS